MNRFFTHLGVQEPHYTSSTITMITDRKLFIVIFVINNISNGENDKYVGTRIVFKPTYMGDSFPAKYLVPEDSIPSTSDLHYYLKSIRSIIVFFDAGNPNHTETNDALGLFFMKAVLKRTLEDDVHKFTKEQYRMVRKVIIKAEKIVSHYIYDRKDDGWCNTEFRVSRIFRDDTSLIRSMKTFNRGVLTNWIRSKEKINDFIQDMDEAKLPKEKYLELSESIANYFIKIPDSDKCLSRVTITPEPINPVDLQPCADDPFCKENIYSSPSIAYNLSHRLLNMILYALVRRCYIHSEVGDDKHMNMLCSFMYREAVYLARRGYFARDLFMEHLALCSLLGYEEFHRRNWFLKVASWVDDEGCIEEFRNFEINRTKLILTQPRFKNPKAAKKMRRLRKHIIEDNCHDHLMSLGLVVLSHAIRHTAHFMQVANQTLEGKETTV